MRINKSDSITPNRVIQKLAAKKAARANDENIWQQIGDYICPTLGDVQNTTTPGEALYNKILDNTAINASELLSSTLHSMLFNPSGYFFGLSTGDPAKDSLDTVRKWIQTVVRTMHNTINNSNFQTEIHEYIQDLVNIATATMSMEEDDETIVRFKARPIREIYISENSKGVVDSVDRCYQLDARGIVDDFGYDNLPPKIKKAYDESKAEKFEIIHSVYPKPRDAKGKYKFISQYVLVCEKENLEVEGFLEFPFIVSRWTKKSGEVYGRGCGEKALPATKMLNKMKETTIKGAQKTIDPPLQAPDDGFVLPLITSPAGLNYYRAGSEDRITPIFNDARIDFGFQMIDVQQRDIRESFYVDQLKLQQGPQKTATETNEIVEQSLRFLGPMMSRQHSETLQPLVERLYAMHERKGLIPDVPEELNGVELKIHYTSIMAMSQRLSEVQNIQRTMQAIAPFQALDPTLGDNFGGDQAVRYIAKLYNFPQELIRDEKERDGIRKQRAKNAQDAAALQTEATQSESASKLIGAAAKLPQQAG